MEWRTFDLHPEYPPEGIPRKALEQRYGSHFTGSVHAMIEDAALPVTRDIEKVPNARGSLVLAELARDEGRFHEFMRATFGAYWVEARDIGDEAVLLELATEAGLGEHEARAELVEQRRLDRVHQSTAEVTGLGATGVPAWVIDRRVLIPGAQPHEVFGRVLERLGHEPLDEDGVGSDSA